MKTDIINLNLQHYKNTKSTVYNTHILYMCTLFITVAVGCQIMHNTLTVKCFTQWKWFNTICIISFTPPSHAACPLCLYYTPPGYQEFNELAY